MSALARLVQRGLALAALAICLLAPFSSAVYGLRTEGLPPKLLLTAAVIALLVATWWQRAALRRGLHALTDRLAALPAAHFWLLALGLGLGLRILWWWLVPFVLPRGGDAVVNWRLVTSLINDGSYVAATTFGTWRGLYPPGLPFALLPFVALFGAGAAAVLAANLCFFLLGAAGVYLSCRSLSDEAHARLGTLLLAIMPNLIAYASQPYKEPLLIAQLAFTVYALARSREAGRWRAAAGWALAAGLALGTAILTQSSLAPALGLLGLLILLETKRRWRLASVAALALGAVLAISPWTLRQSLTFGKLVPLTTGAGWSFYTGNNPVALGGFTAYEDFFPDLLSIDEREVSRIAFERGMAYVKAHPQRFAELTVRRALMMTCCADPAVADSLGAAGFPDSTFRFWRSVSCIAWCALALLVLLNARALLAAARSQPVLASALAFPVVVFVVHGAMEAGARHTTMNFGIWILAAMVGLAGRQRV